MDLFNVSLERTHLALRLPEIVGNILSFLVDHPTSTTTKGTLASIYPCLLVNRLWNDCALRVMMRHPVFEDNRHDINAFFKFADMICNAPVSGNHPALSRKPSLAATLAVATPPPPRKSPSEQPRSTASSQTDDYRSSTSDWPLFPTTRRTALTMNHQARLRTARRSLRSLSLRKIKEKTILGPLQMLGREATHLEKLEIYICDTIMDINILPFVSHGRLTVLTLAGCHNVTDALILRVAEHCRELEHLDLRACGQVSDTSISAIARNCPRLRHLNVGRVRDRDRITGRSIGLIALYTEVAVLGLAGCDIDDECMLLLAKHRNAGLERISVNNCYRLTNKALQAHVRLCHKLCVFELKECHYINDWASVAELVRRRVLLTLCEQQNRACSDWAKKNGMTLNVKPPLK